MKKTMDRFRQLLDHPIKIGLATFAIALASLLAEGTLIDLWSLKTEKFKFNEKYKSLVQENIKLQEKILQARNSDKFIAKQARERLD